MVVEVVRTYLDAASGFTELTRQRAVMAAKTLLRESDERHSQTTPARSIPIPGGEEEVARGGVGASIQALAAELVETSAANRAALSELVERELDRALNAAELVRRDDYERLLRRVADLERRLAAVNSAPRAAREAEAAKEIAGQGPQESEDTTDARASEGVESSAPLAGGPSGSAAQGAGSASAGVGTAARASEGVESSAPLAGGPSGSAAQGVGSASAEGNTAASPEAGGPSLAAGKPETPDASKKAAKQPKASEDKAEASKSASAKSVPAKSASPKTGSGRSRSAKSGASKRGTAASSGKARNK